MLHKPGKQAAPIGAADRGSTWFSGCGISPSTLSSSFSTPAIAFCAPLGSSRRRRWPSGVGVAEETRPSPSIRAIVSRAAK